MASSDADLIRESLRKVLRADGVSGKHLEAKAAAARQLAKMEGLLGEMDPQKAQESAPDPMTDFDELALARERRRSRRRAS